jgi:sulfatase modifying factor 1
MKKSVPIIFFVIITGCVIHKYDFDTVRKTPELKFETPPGGVWLHDNIFMDQTEVRNLDYLEFLWWTSRKEPAKLKSITPDTAVWRDSSFYNEPYVQYYLRHPSYRDYPAVGISYEQAVAFCTWRSDRVNEFIYIRDHKIKWNADSTYHCPEIMHYRLPTKEEWEFASAAGLPYSLFPLGYENIFDKHHFLVSTTIESGEFYFDPKSKQYISRHSGVICLNPNLKDGNNNSTSPVHSGTPNKYGIYNLLGNVSEIIADDVFKGLNYQTMLDGRTFKLKSSDYKIIDSTSNGYDYKYTFRYQKPQAWLGFRCVCEVLRPKK